MGAGDGDGTEGDVITSSVLAACISMGKQSEPE
jgi:hypothetical protein